MINRNFSDKKLNLTAIVLTLLLCMCTGFSSLADNSTISDTPNLGSMISTSTVTPSPSIVRYLGRSAYAGEMLLMTNAGSGCEFSFYGDRLSITFAGDGTTEEGHEVPKEQARVAIYVNGERTIDTLIDQPEKTIEVINSAENNDYKVRVVKLSESLVSVTAIKNITFHAIRNLKPTEPKNTLIEFVGDSITNAMGVDDPDQSHRFSTATEDVTKGYAYRTAEMLDADCSILAFSGYGVLPGNDSIIGSEYIVPKNISQYYDKLSFSRENIATINAQNIDWDFTRQADIVVINLGTNDYKYIQSGANTVDEFKSRYKELVGFICEKNPNAVILCTLGIMGQELCQAMEEAVYEMNSAPGSRVIQTMRFDEQLASDGYGISMHPSAITHEKAAKALSERIIEIRRLVNIKASSDGSVIAD